MEEPVKDQQSSTTVSAKGPKTRLRYPLRSSAAKLKPDKSPPAADRSVSSAPKRARATSSVTKSVSVLDLSGKEKSAKPPRRLSIPSKSAVSPRPKPASNITPISEARIRKSLNIPSKSETPLSDISKSSARRKFNALSSASYWISQIKISESVPNHSISLGFFKLALEAGCEPLHRIRDELKTYVCRHNLTDLGETVKNLLESYGISETVEQLQVSETCSQVPADVTQSSSNEAVSSTKSPMSKKLKSKSLNAETAPQVPKGKDFPVKSATKTTSASKLRSSTIRKSTTLRPAAESGAQNLQKKIQKPRKQESDDGQEKIKKQEKKPADEAPTKPLEAEEIVEENKENMDGPPFEETSVIEAY